MLRQRVERTRQIEALGFRPYGHRFDASHTLPEIAAAIFVEIRRGIGRRKDSR
jgi:hypothetical protein